MQFSQFDVSIKLNFSKYSLASSNDEKGPIQTPLLPTSFSVSVKSLP